MGPRLKGCGPFGFSRSRLCGPQGTNSLWARSGSRIGKIRSNHECTWTWVNLISHRVGQGSFGFGSLDPVFIYTCTLHRFDEAKEIQNSFSQVSLSLFSLSLQPFSTPQEQETLGFLAARSIKGKKSKKALAPSPLQPPTLSLLPLLQPPKHQV